jgi:hypothetical protein
MTNWVSVKDRLPEDHQRVLAINDRKDIQLVLYRKIRTGYTPWSKEWFIGCFGRDSGTLRNPEIGISDVYLDNVTHWMPLPKPPKEIGE